MLQKINGVMEIEGMETPFDEDQIQNIKMVSINR